MIKTLKQLEREAITESLDRHDRNVVKVSAELGCSPRKIHSRMKIWGIPYAEVKAKSPGRPKKVQVKSVSIEEFSTPRPP